jgi:hypothetical protein
VLAAASNLASAAHVAPASVHEDTRAGGAETGGAGAVEHSGLSFPHAKHLVPRLRAPIGEVQLSCADCHVPDTSRATMQPIIFAKNCQRCHSLAFDELHPDRQAPHAEPAVVRRGVLEFYATLALTGEARDPQAPEVARRRPGRDLTEPERLEALALGRSAHGLGSERLARRQRPCDECHAVAQTDAGYRGRTRARRAVRGCGALAAAREVLARRAHGRAGASAVTQRVRRRRARPSCCPRSKCAVTVTRASAPRTARSPRRACSVTTSITPSSGRCGLTCKRRSADASAGGRGA